MDFPLGVRFLLPKEAQKFIYEFDTAYPIDPFSFEIELEE